MTTLEKIRIEIEQNAYPIVHGVNNHEKGMTLYGILQIFDKYAGEPCDDAISRQAVLDYLKTNVDDFPDYHEAIEKVLQIPSVRPQEQTGHWIIDEGSLDALYGEVCKCSECGVESIGESDFCPNCGAKMESEDKE